MANLTGERQGHIAKLRNAYLCRSREFGRRSAPTPQTSETSGALHRESGDVGIGKVSNAVKTGFFLAIKFANFAKVFVRPDANASRDSDILANDLTHLGSVIDHAPTKACQVNNVSSML
ncbi:hypothetical protein [Rhizobium sp. CECT 9324]|uniref:hypothetical protein n=1 Tax=Rhizobium sp. CECT 9324 TaxID=2845820 RepID=UPI001E3499DC|nr:hypothetical protein [Rhizobium sp. CECT 9324]